MSFNWHLHSILKVFGIEQLYSQLLLFQMITPLNVMLVLLSAMVVFPAELITVNSDYSIQPYDNMQPFGGRQVQGGEVP